MDKKSDGSETVFDAVIVGSGAGGGPMALSLAQAGWKVLVLEKGPRWSRRDYDHETGISPGAFVPAVEEDPHTVVTRKTTRPLLTSLGWIASCVGGGTVHMGGYFYRFLPDDFRMKSRFGDYEELEDWPFTYEELEPFYAEAERELGVSGAAGADPFEGPRSTPYPLPPLSAHPFASRVEAACKSRGLHPFPTPRAIVSQEYDGRPACEYCPRCASYGCPVGARSSSQEALLPKAERTGNCEVRAGAMVFRILVEGDRATGCLYFDAEGREHRVRARVVCVAGSAIESARLLLASGTAAFADGLGNENGLVGRHLQFHGVTMGQGRFETGRPGLEALADPHPMLGRSVMDHYFLPDGVSELAKGGVIRFGMAPQVPAPGPFPVGPDDRVLYFEGFHDFIPNRHTFVSLDPEVKDRWGLPVARIHLDLPAHQKKAGAFLADRAFEVLSDLGASQLALTDLGGTSSYLVHGTCRAGHDPRRSVLDAHCRVHSLRNLYVVDGSFMPTSGGAAPTLTIVANSFRVARHLREKGLRREI